MIAAMTNEMTKACFLYLVIKSAVRKPSFANNHASIGISKVIPIIKLSIVSVSI